MSSSSPGSLSTVEWRDSCNNLDREIGWQIIFSLLNSVSPISVRYPFNRFFFHEKKSNYLSLKLFLVNFFSFIRTEFVCRSELKNKSMNVFQHVDVSHDRPGAAQADEPTRLFHSQRGEGKERKKAAQAQNFPPNVQHLFGSGTLSHSFGFRSAYKQYQFGKSVSCCQSNWILF